MNTKHILKHIAPHAIAIVAFLVVVIIYFLPQFQGESLLLDDRMQFEGMIHEVVQVEEQTGERPLWTDAMFGGMPTYQLGAPKKGNQLVGVADVLSLWLNRPAGYFFLAMVCSYILFITIGVNPFIAIAGSVGYSITTYHLNVYDAGHAAKMYALVFSALIIAGVIQTLKEKWLTGFVLFTLGLGLNLMANHYQMTYYLFIALLVMGIVETIRAARQGELTRIGKALGVFVVGTALAVGASASKIITTYEYSKDTMRGEPILTLQSDTPSSSSEVEGLEWTYAMNWSNGPLDLFATVIPGVAGGSSAEKLGPGTETYEAFKRSGMPMQREDNRYQAPLYWGVLPFTSGPAYVGILFMFLFVLGVLTIKSPIKWWISISVLIIYLLSMGKNFEFFSRLFFDYFPMYNKFRAPSSILGVSGLLIPTFGVYALSELLRKKPSWLEVKRSFLIASGITGGICLFFALIGPSVFDFVSPSDVQYQNTGLPELLVADRKALMTSDSWRCLLILAIGAGALWAYLNNKLKYVYTVAIIAIVAIFDLWSVGRRYLDWADFEKGLSVEGYYQPREVDTQILNRESRRGDYRVFDLSISTFNSARASYYHNTIGGYHAAKLQRYQDIIDRHISQNNTAVLNMLNTKYVISREERMSVNPEALGPAWFVGGVRFVDTPDEEIDALSSFNPANSAIVHAEFRDIVKVANASQEGSIVLETYLPNHLTYKTSSGSEQIAIFSEIWYGPNKGWQAYIDGQPVDHFRANYILRGLVVPSGEHTIEFVFDPVTFRRGVAISYVSSILIILILLGSMVYGGRETLRKWSQEPAEEPIAPRSSLTKPKRKKKK